MNKSKSNQFIKIKGSNNPVLNTVGNVCGWIANLFQIVQIRWGTMYEWDFDNLDLEEDINKPEYKVDEIW